MRNVIVTSMCVFLTTFASTVSAEEASTTLAGEWKTVELTGLFQGYGSHNAGQGKTQFSFALEQPCEARGDVCLVVSYSSDGTSVDFRLNGYYFTTLGPLSSPPTSITGLPADFATPAWRSKEPKHMTIGHYYVLVKPETAHAVLIQILDFKCTEREFVKKGFFNNTYKATGTLSFRYLAQRQSGDENGSRISGKPQPTAKPTATTVPPQKGPDTTGGNVAPPSTEVAPLAGAYEQFQNDAKAFLDLPSEQVTVPKCDVILETAKNLTTRINDQIGEVDSTITGNGAKVSSLNERLARITDLQLRDRTQTRISKIKEETERLQKDLKEWTAKLYELQKTEKKLREYRLIIGI